MPLCDPLINGSVVIFISITLDNSKPSVDGPFSEKNVAQQLSKWIALITEAQHEAYQNDTQNVPLTRCMGRRCG